jgi:hypothetical protein
VLRKNLTSGLLLVIVLLSIFFIENIELGSASTTVGGLIKEDQTWTKSGSPYNLIGALSVDSGATLTIQPGVTVNINNYYIQINGTLIAKGSNTEKIVINSNIPYYDGSIRFTTSSPDWNDQTGLGNIIENCILNSTLIASVNAIKFDNSAFTSATDGVHAAHLGGSSIVTNSEIHGALILGDYSIVTNNVFYNGGVLEGKFLKISNNKGGYFMANNSTISNNNLVAGNVFGSGSIITGNTITGSVSGEFITNNRIDGDATGNVVTGNVVTKTGGVAVKGTFVSNNTIIGGGNVVPFSFYGGDDEPTHWVGAVETSGSSVISNNVINGGITGGGSPQITNNKITGSIAIGGGSNYFGGSTTDDSVAGSVVISSNTVIGDNYRGVIVYANSISITGNRLFNSSITVKAPNTIIKNNALYGSGQGIQVPIEGWSTLIERNLISDSEQGVLAYSGTTIKNNTFSNCGISINGNPSAIMYNNIEQSRRYTVHLLKPDSVSATSNWWGTTDTKNIDDLIYDVNSDFNLGTVNYKPFLNQANTQAMPDLTTPPDSGNLPTVTPLPQPSINPPEIALYAIIGATAALIITAVILLRKKKK